MTASPSFSFDLERSIFVAEEAGPISNGSENGQKLPFLPS
jgi:hypothetical protein